MSAADEAYSYAKERILDGRLAGGELISEGEVANATGLSRTPVREAFLRLEGDGLLRLFPKRGALVVPVSPAEVEAVMETRFLIEMHAIERAIETAADLGDGLATVIARQQLAVAAEDPQAFVEGDHEFHRTFVAACGNPILLELHDSLRDRQSRMGLTAIAREAGRMDTILREHAEIAATVARHDGERVSTLMRDHLDGTLQLLRSAPRASAFQPPRANTKAGTAASASRTTIQPKLEANAGARSVPTSD
jgi:DNA-binding GntR family transcriptional regulator